MLKKCWSYFAIVVVSLLLLSLSSCYSLYVQDVKSYLPLPDGSPVVTSVRNEGETRLGVGLTINPRHSLDFNDGRYYKSTTSRSDTSSVAVVSHYDNVHLKYPVLQGTLSIDYMITDHFLVYGKVNAGIADSIPVASVNLGAGCQFGVKRLSFNAYLSPLLYLMNSEAVLRVGNGVDYVTSEFNSKLIDKWLVGLTAGVRFVTIELPVKFNIGWGLDIALLDYVQYTPKNPGDPYYDGYKNTSEGYRVLLLKPAFTILKTFGPSQVDAGVNLDLPLVDNSSSSDDEIFPQDWFFTIKMNYSYCFGMKHSQKSTDVK